MSWNPIESNRVVNFHLTVQKTLDGQWRSVASREMGPANLGPDLVCTSPERETALEAAKRAALRTVSSSGSLTLLDEVRFNFRRLRDEISSEEKERRATQAASLVTGIARYLQRGTVRQGESRVRLRNQEDQFGSWLWVGGVPYAVSYILTGTNPVLVFERRWSNGYEEELWDVTPDRELATQWVGDAGVRIRSTWRHSTRAGFSLQLDIPNPKASLTCPEGPPEGWWSMPQGRDPVR